MRWSVVLCAIMTAVNGRLGPYITPISRLPLRLTATELNSYVDRTFGQSQRCLKVAADDTAEAAAIVVALNQHRSLPSKWQNDTTGHATPVRTIELDNDSAAEDGQASCLAYVVVGRQLSVVEKFMDNFRRNAAERMLVIIVQDNKYIKPFIKYSPEYFNYKDIILIIVYPQQKTVYHMSLYYRKFVPIPKHQEQWLRHDLEGKRKVKNFYTARIKLLAYNNSFFSSVIKDNETGKLSLSYGIECTIFKEIATRLNITWDVYTTDDKDKWGTIWSNNTVTGGALKYLSTKQVDVSFCSFWIEKDKLTYVDLSRLWTTVCLKFLVPKPQPLREKWDLLFKPFSLSLWLLVFFSAILTTITVWAFAGIQKKIGYTRINIFMSLSSTIFWIIGTMLLTNSLRTYQMGPIRQLINGWSMFILIMSTSFSSILYSYITSPIYTDIVLEVEDMVKANYYWGLTYPPPFTFILNMEDPVHRKFSEKFVPEHTIEDRIRRLERGKYAMLTKCVYGKHFMESEEVPVALLNDLRTTRGCLSQFYVGIGFAKHSPYVRPASLVIQRIFESGLIDYWLSRVTEVRMSPATFKQVYEIQSRESGRPSPLSYRQFKVVMAVWMVGCTISMIALAAERQYDAYARHQRI